MAVLWQRYRDPAHVQPDQFFDAAGQLVRQRASPAQEALARLIQKIDAEHVVAQDGNHGLECCLQRRFQFLAPHQSLVDPGDH